jgi:hypothetical protein
MAVSIPSSVTDALGGFFSNLPGQLGLQPSQVQPGGGYAGAIPRALEGIFPGAVPTSLLPEQPSPYGSFGYEEDLVGLDPPMTKTGYYGRRSDDIRFPYPEIGFQGRPDVLAADAYPSQDYGPTRADLGQFPTVPGIEITTPAQYLQSIEQAGETGKQIIPRNFPFRSKSKEFMPEYLESTGPEPEYDSRVWFNPVAISRDPAFDVNERSMASLSPNITYTPTPPFGPVPSTEEWQARLTREAGDAITEAQTATREALFGGRTESGMVEPLDPSITRAWDTDRETWDIKRNQGNIPGTPLAVPAITTEDYDKFDVRSHIQLAYGLEPETAPANWPDWRVSATGLIPKTPDFLRDIYADRTDSPAIVENLADEYQDLTADPQTSGEADSIYNKDKDTGEVSGDLIRTLKDVVNNEVIREGREFGLSAEQVYNSPNIVFDPQQLSALAEQLASGSKKDFTDKDVMELTTQVESFAGIPEAPPPDVEDFSAIRDRAAEAASKRGREAEATSAKKERAADKAAAKRQAVADKRAADKAAAARDRATARAAKASRAAEVKREAATKKRAEKQRSKDKEAQRIWDIHAKMRKENAAQRAAEEARRARRYAGGKGGALMYT